MAKKRCRTCKPRKSKGAMRHRRRTKRGKRC